MNRSVYQIIIDRQESLFTLSPVLNDFKINFATERDYAFSPYLVDDVT